jgi:predicted alpha/beta superfamily hydrolase
VSGPNLRKHQGFRSRFLRNERDLVVYLPPGYDDQPGRHFPVLYLHDGQNLFDPSTSFIPGMDWNVGQTADQSINAGVVEPLLIVGSGRADGYARFLIEELKPFIEREYRTLSGPPKTGIGGSSLGGLVSLYLGLKLPHVFGKLAALSPSVWWNQQVIDRFAAAANVYPRPSIWLDIGTREGPRTVQDVERFRDVLLEKGWQLGRDLHYQRIEGGEHNEAAWAQRVGPFLQFLYPAR